MRHTFAIAIRKSSIIFSSYGAGPTRNPWEKMVGAVRFEPSLPHSRRFGKSGFQARIYWLYWRFTLDALASFFHPNPKLPVIREFALPRIRHCDANQLILIIVIKTARAVAGQISLRVVLEPHWVN